MVRLMRFSVQLIIGQPCRTKSGVCGKKGVDKLISFIVVMNYFFCNAIFKYYASFVVTDFVQKVDSFKGRI